jgi:hypothetical protein
MFTKIYLMIKNKSFFLSIFRVFFILLTILLPLLFNFSGCENNPNSLGLNYISPIDTLDKKVLESSKDSILITSTNTLKYVNTSLSPYIFVGRYQTYESRSLLKFISLPSGYDSFTVVSSKLKLRYNNSFFKDSLGLNSFNCYKLNRYIDFSQVTFDQVTSSDIGNTSLGTYSGILTDTAYITIPFDNQIVSQWLKSVSDTNTYKNYGFVLLSNTNSTTIRGFYSANISSLGPMMTVVLNKGSRTDTVNFNYTTTTFIADAPSSIIPNGRIILQSGVSYHGTLKFDLSKLPYNVIINEAYLELKLDPAYTFISQSFQDRRIAIAMLTDTTLQNTDNIYFYTTVNDSVTHGIRLNSIFQKWSSGTAVNYGIQLKNITDLSGLNECAIYSPLASDVIKRPYLRILYTIRN